MTLFAQTIGKLPGLAVAAALLLAWTPAQATPGRLDGCGCHHSKRAGYHCHGVSRCKTIHAPAKTPTKRKAP
jgi:hypothetical protein